MAQTVVVEGREALLSDGSRILLDVWRTDKLGSERQMLDRIAAEIAHIGHLLAQAKKSNEEAREILDLMQKALA